MNKPVDQWNSKLLSELLILYRNEPIEKWIIKMYLSSSPNKEFYRAVVKNTCIRNPAYPFRWTAGQQSGSANATVVVHLCAKCHPSTHFTRNNPLKKVSPKKLPLDALFQTDFFFKSSPIKTWSFKIGQVSLWEKKKV